MNNKNHLLRFIYFQLIIVLLLIDLLPAVVLSSHASLQTLLRIFQFRLTLLPQKSHIQFFRMSDYQFYGLAMQLVSFKSMIKYFLLIQFLQRQQG